MALHQIIKYKFEDFNALYADGKTLETWKSKRSKHLSPNKDRHFLKHFIK